MLRGLGEPTSPFYIADVSVLGGSVADWANFKGRPHLNRCRHSHTLVTVTAGIERTVCEDCGHVSVRYIEDTVKLYPGISDLDSPRAGESGKRFPCGRCGAAAVFMTPGGLACAEHAWASASRQDIIGDELWIPIRINQGTRASG